MFGVIIKDPGVLGHHVLCAFYLGLLLGNGECLYHGSLYFS